MANFKIALLPLLFAGLILFISPAMPAPSVDAMANVSGIVPDPDFLFCGNYQTANRDDIIALQNELINRKDKCVTSEGQTYRHACKGASGIYVESPWDKTVLDCAVIAEFALGITDSCCTVWSSFLKGVSGEQRKNPQENGTFVVYVTSANCSESPLMPVDFAVAKSADCKKGPWGPNGEPPSPPPGTGWQNIAPMLGRQVSAGFFPAPEFGEPTRPLNQTYYFFIRHLVLALGRRPPHAHRAALQRPGGISGRQYTDQNWYLAVALATTMLLCRVPARPITRGARMAFASSEEEISGSRLGMVV
ncbi:hypothetical protein OQA88_10946 [Cercophora sp. LCS_1]